ncbi:MAG TPA: DUF885 family protein, partial [Candidatus Eisenbacteria bacterium]|nr:DUF885 family protein [Candidatus Eisenbacteria bacterium]
MSAVRLLAAALGVLLIATPGRCGAAGAPAGAGDQIRKLGDEYLARRLEGSPDAATRLGVHDTDHLLLPARPVPATEAAAWTLAFLARLDAVPRQGLSPEREAERALLAAVAGRDLVGIEVLRPRERDPGWWARLVSDAIDAVLDRQGVSSCGRVRLAVRRLERVPDALRAARIELRDPPRVLTEEAIVRFEAVLRFYRETVPALAAGCRSALMQADLAQADTAAVRAVEGFIAYLREDLLPVSNGALAIGPEGCRRLLESELLVEVAPIETLLVAEGRAL